MRLSSFLLLACALLWSSTGCGDPPKAGARCIHPSDCPAGMGCYLIEATGSRRCLAECDISQVVRCTEDAHGSTGLCAPLDPAEDDGVCLLGGTVATGLACVSSAQCEVGSMCVTEGSGSTCRVACDAMRGGADCRREEECRLLDGAASSFRGFCAIPES